jgi:hypothetical protein
VFGAGGHASVHYLAAWRYPASVGEQQMSVSNPTLDTTPSPTTVTLGPPVTLSDTADLELGFNPTGSITFTLIGPDGTTVVDTEMVLVSGNGLYFTPTGFTPSGPFGAGTYQWNATYSGDANNEAASDIDDPAEQVTVNQDTPTLSTVPDQTTVTLGPPVTLHDAAFLQDGYNPTGSITFTLIGPDGTTVVDTEMVLVSGNGLYSTPTGFTPSGPFGAGTYQWNATYSGDANNAAASDIDDPAEQVTVNKDSPTLSTIPDQTTVTLGPPVTLHDAAFLQDGYNSTGSITFTLIGPDGTTVVDTEMVLVSGNGLYFTPTGFTPSGPYGAGTYQWNATYSGDANNEAASDIDDPAEQVTVVACYRRGTLILTPAGEVPVEELAIGDRIVALAGEERPIRWIGYRAYDGRFIAGNRQVLPICVMADAMAPGVPARDLYLSPEHSLWIDGVLVQAKHLVNGATIVQAEGIDQVEYFHVELDEHDVIFADGAAAETFVDCDNRLMFANGAEYARLYPSEDRPRWQFCAERLEWDSDELTDIRAALAWRAASLGHDLDGDPDLHLIVDGEIIRAETADGRRHRFTLPAGAAEIEIASFSSVPREIEPASRDVRRLGVPVERIVLRDADMQLEIGHGSEALSNGFHAAEPGHRWTDGRGRLSAALLAPFAGPLTLDLCLAPNALHYRPRSHVGSAA